MQDQDLDWGKCVWLCTDQAASVAGWSFGCNRKNKKKLQTKICFLHNARIAVNI